MDSTNPFQILPPLYSSQSATSCYQECPRRRLFNYHLYGTGIVPNFTSVPLTTGTSVHIGIGDIALQYIRLHQTKDTTEFVNIDSAVEIGKEHYRQEVAKYPLANITEPNQERIFHEQLALVEALIRLWYLKEWPTIIKFYDILAVEQEILFPILDRPDGKVLYQSRPDLILLDKRNGDIVGYSLKTTKLFNERTEESLTCNLQGITEPYGIQVWLEQVKRSIQESVESLEGGLGNIAGFLTQKITSISKFLNKYSNLPTRPSSTRFCYLIKGDWKEENKGAGDYRTDNPLIYGWRKFTASGIEYAWTYWTKNDNNKSGYGRLGKGWERFSVWDDTNVDPENFKGGGVKGWIEKLNKQDGISNDIGDGNVLDKYVLGQPDIFVNPDLIRSRLLQVEAIELSILQGLTALNGDGDKEVILDTCFPMNTQACFFPSKCDYLSICPNGSRYFKQHIADDPLSEEFNAFRRRESHHMTEQEHFEQCQKQNT